MARRAVLTIKKVEEVLMTSFSKTEVHFCENLLPNFILIIPNNPSRRLLMKHKIKPDACVFEKKKIDFYHIIISINTKILHL